MMKVCDSAPTETLEHVIIPDYCTLTNYEGNTQIKFSTEFLVNGEGVSHAICFSSVGSCLFQILNHEVRLLFPVTCNQNNIDGLLFVLSNLKICKGIFSTEQNNDKKKENKLETEIWKSILDKRMHEVRCRSKSCRKILSILVTSDVCPSCSSMYRMRKKRKLDVSKKEPVEPLKQNINLLNIDETDISIFSKETKITKKESSNDPKENENIEMNL